MIVECRLGDLLAAVLFVIRAQMRRTVWRRMHGATPISSQDLVDELRQPDRLLAKLPF